MKYSRIKAMEPQETAERLRAVGFIFTVRELHRLAFVPLVSEESIRLLKKNLKPSPSCPRETDQSISLYVSHARFSFSLKASDSPEKL